MSKQHPWNDWADSQTEDDMNDRFHWNMQHQGNAAHKGQYSATCPACFEVNPSVVRHASKSDAEGARAHLSTQQFNKMFGNRK